MDPIKSAPSEPLARENPILAEHAAAIRQLGRQTVENVVEIGRRLAECRLLLKEEGTWRSWLDCELKLSPQSAGRLIQVYEQRSKLEHLNLPVSALYLLAAPSTPEAAKTEIIARAQAGEVVPIAEVKVVVERHRQPSSKRRTESAKRKRRSSQEVRLEAFFESLLFVTTACTASVEMEIPDLNEKQRNKAIAQLKEASAALGIFGNRFKDDDEKVCDDIGPDSANEAARLRVYVEKLEADKRRLEIRVAGLEREVEELRGKLATGTGGMSVGEFQAAHKRWEDTLETQRRIITHLEKENAKLRAEVGPPPADPGDLPPLPGFLDRTRRAAQ
jgi:hypothetical protein